MKIVFKTSLLTLVLITSVITVTGCTKKEKSNIVGTWKHGSYIYTFKNDKTCTYNAAGTKMKCTYKINGDKLSILYDGNTTPFETTYSIDGNKLNVKDSFGNNTIYNKK